MGRDAVKAVKTGLAVLGLVGLMGCASPQPPQDQYHRIQHQPHNLPLASRVVLPGVVEINRLDSDGLLSQRSLAYEQPDRSLAQYDYDLWTDTPSAMLRDVLAEMLAQSRVATQVVTPDLRVPADWMIRGRLFRFEHQPASGTVVARFSLSVVSARNGRLIWMQTYQATPNVVGNRPADAALALNHAAGQCLTQFLADLAQLPAEMDPQSR